MSARISRDIAHVRYSSVLSKALELPKMHLVEYCDLKAIVLRVFGVKPLAGGKYAKTN